MTRPLPPASDLLPPPLQAARVLRSKHSALAHVLLSDLTNTGVFMEGESQVRVDDQ